MLDYNSEPEDEEIVDDIDEIDIDGSTAEINEDVSRTQIVSLPILTVFIQTNMIGSRVEQLARESPSMLPKEDVDEIAKNYPVEQLWVEVAKEELRRRIIPIKVAMQLPGGTKWVEVGINEFLIPNAIE